MLPSRPEQVVELVRQKIVEWRKKGIGERTIIGIGISMQGFRAPGPMTCSSRRSFWVPGKICRWKPISPRRSPFLLLRKNNATASALAEYYLGAGQGCDTLTYLSFNHGFGAGIYSGNRPFLGGHGNAGEIGALYLADELDKRPALSGLLRTLTERGMQLDGVMDMTSAL